MKQSSEIMDLIKEKVCEHYSVRNEDLTGKRRTRQFVTPRQVAACRQGRQRTT